MDEGTSSEPVLIKKKKSLVPVIAFVLVGALTIAAGFYFFRSVRKWIASTSSTATTSDIVENNQSDNENTPADDGDNNSKIFLDTDNRFSFKYPENIKVETKETNEVAVMKDEKPIIIITPRTLKESSVKSEVDTQYKLLGATGNTDITKIGARAGYVFDYQNKKYMYFPLGLDSILEIKVEGEDKTLIDSIVQTIEFLPTTSASS